MIQSHPTYRIPELPLQVENIDIDPKQEDDGNGSDEDQMVICEEPQSTEIDLKCKDKLTDSDNDVQDDDQDKKSRYSPSIGGLKREGQGVKADVTCRPKPIKGKSLRIPRISNTLYCRKSIFLIRRGQGVSLSKFFQVYIEFTIRCCRCLSF